MKIIPATVATADYAPLDSLKGNEVAYGMPLCGRWVGALTPIVLGVPAVLVSLGLEPNASQRRITDITDGTSRTIMVAEDVGRYEGMAGSYPDPVDPTQTRAFWRWAEPDGGPTSCRGPGVVRRGRRA